MSRGDSMKRDWDLIREILLKVEEKENDNRDTLDRQELDLENVTDEKFFYNTRLMKEDGLIDGEFNIAVDGLMPTHLTNAGHDFLDKARSQMVWNKFKEAIPKDIKTMSFEMVKAILIKIVTSAVFGQIP